MLVTLLPMVMEVKLVQLENAELPMLVTLLGITVVLNPAISSFLAVSIIALQLSRESYTLFSESTCIVFKLEQPEYSYLVVTQYFTY